MTCWQIFLNELKTLMRNFPLLLTLIGGSLGYSILYAQPYLGQLPRENSIILVDEDDTHISRRLSFFINSSPWVKIVHTTNKKEEIQKYIKQKKAFGYLHISHGFAKDLLLHKSPSIAFGSNANYMLVYGLITQGLNESLEAFYEELNIKNANKAQILLNAKAVFNYTGGYLNYILPSVFILIIHQLFVIASAMQTSNILHNPKSYAKNLSILKVMLLRLFMFFCIFLVVVLFFFGFVFDFYGISTLANINDLMLLILAFIFSACTLGFFLGSLIKRAEIITFLVLISSLVLVFLSGFIWPHYAMSGLVLFFASFVPITHAILAFLKINQFGVELINILHEWQILFALALMYFIISYFIMLYKKKNI